MSLETYRQQLVTAIEVQRALWTDYTLEVEYDNRDNIDLQAQANPFLCAEILFIDGKQADLSSNPVHRVVGMLILTAKTREGMGSAKGYTLLDHFYPSLQHRVIGNVRLEMASFSRPKLVGGWWGISAILPFHINKFS